MPAAQIPLWVTIAGSFGVGGFVGNLISSLLASRSQRRNWEKDNKKQEWRELIDALREALRVMREHRYESFADNFTPAEDVRYREEAMRRGYVAIGDRIFVVKKVRDSGLLGQWDKLREEYEKVDASIPEGLNSLITMLKDYLNGRQEGLVFPSRNGKPLRNNNVLRRRLHPILQALSIREGGMHGFRHGRVSFLVENNTPVDVIKAWIGHGSERMVRLYTHLRPQYRSRVLASIPSLVGNQVALIDPLTHFSTRKK